MALIPSSRYPAQVDADAAYPRGKARNSGSFQDGTGTPLDKDWVNDLWGFQQALLDAAGVTPSGTPDQVGASQYLDALQALTRSRDLRSLMQLRPLSIGSSGSLGAFGLDTSSVEARGRVVLVQGGSVSTVGDAPVARISVGAPATLTTVRKVTGTSLGRILAVGSGGNGNAFSTNDGETWTAGGAFGGSFGTVSDVVYEGSHFIARSGVSARFSVSGTTWFIPATNISDAIGAFGTDGGLAVLGTGAATIASSGVKVAITVNDGATWTEASDIPSTLGPDPQSYVVSDGGYIGSPPDAFAFVRAGGFEPGEVVECWRTTDAATWTKLNEIDFGEAIIAPTPPSGFRALMCRDTGLMLVAVSDGAGLRASCSADRGRTWSALVTYDGGITPLTMALARGRIFAAGDDGVYASDPIL